MNTKSFHKLLVPTDFSEVSLSALDYLQSFNTFKKVTVYLLHIIENAPMVAFPAVELDSEIVMRNAEEDAVADIDGIIKDRVHGLENVVPVIRRGIPYVEITQFAKTANVDLIVMATHGRTGVTHAIMGSVAEKVIRYSSVPVLTVKPPEMDHGNVRGNNVDGQLRIPNGT
jgi:nucleotide-binding universal stress UspA family protein